MKTGELLFIATSFFFLYMHAPEISENHSALSQDKDCYSDFNLHMLCQPFLVFF